MQRLFDIIFSGIALLILSPLILPLMFILRVTGEGEVFFTQIRVGRSREVFKLYKFATMLKDSPNMGTGTVTLRKDPRILPLGGWLRGTKINELPQLINIFNGDMSVIGPRPQTQRCFDAFPKSAQQAIVKVRPGLSGVGSIVFRSEEEMMHANKNPNKFYDEVLMPYKGILEIWYVDNSSLWNYFLLIGVTVYSVIWRSSIIIFKLFPSMPSVPNALKSYILDGNDE